MTREDLRDFYNSTAGKRQKWRARNRFYHDLLERYFKLMIPDDQRVLEIGCGTGELLHAMKPRYGLGIDFSSSIIELARQKFPDLEFLVQDAETMEIGGKFDYIILSDLVCSLWDVQQMFQNILGLCEPQTRIVISNYSFLWEPVMKFGEFLHIKQKQPYQNWLSADDLTTLLELTGFQKVTLQRHILFPKYLPIFNLLLNRFLVHLPLINHLAMINLIVARPAVEEEKDYKVSIIVPARNESGNIENAILRTPAFGSSVEFIFVEGHSADNTWEEMLRVQAAHPGKDIRVMRQGGKGKGNAVREGFEAAHGEVLMILDADLTTPPEDLPKFYRALARNSGEFINGCRLVYPMEKEAMRFLNYLANKFFGLFFTYLLGQRIKDTLCGTKVLFASDYRRINQNRSYFGDFDPFGDFDLLFGAAKLNLKITEIIVHYKDREYGTTQISRFKHGWLLVKMSLFAARKIKFI